MSTQYRRERIVLLLLDTATFAGLLPRKSASMYPMTCMPCTGASTRNPTREFCMLKRVSLSLSL